MSVYDQAELIRAAAAEELGLCRRLFDAVGLTCSPPELVAWKQSEGEYTAELKVEFFKEGDLVDIFEFFVCRDGVITTTEQEVRAWIRENVPDVVQRRSG